MFSGNQIKRSAHLIEDLQVERVHAWWHSALNDFVPSGIFGPIVCSWCLIHGVAKSNSTVRIHAGHTVVFSQFGLQNNTKTIYSRIQSGKIFPPILIVKDLPIMQYHILKI